MISHKTAAFLLLLTIVLFSLRAAAQSSDPCSSFGRCGPFGLCDSRESPICSCLQGFDPSNRQEWDAGNWTSGCVRRTRLRCESNGTTEDGFVELQKLKISNYSDRWVGPEAECQGRCLENCTCVAYGFDTGIGCMFWRRALMDVQRFQGGFVADLYIRLADSDLDRKKDHKKIIVPFVVISFFVLSVCVYFSWNWMKKKRGEAAASDPVDESIEEALSRVNLEELPLYKYEVLAAATDNFSEANRLGKGGFGPVYRGELANGKEIAVKCLSKASGQGMQEFMNEVVLISKLQHRNLVKLVGCTVENKETMLIYEYMPNKSLDVFLFDPSQEVLDWRKRFNIIEGICRGLIYLHRDSRVKIIHRDLKPSNILLDNDWNPKISDFGMARIFGVKQDHVSTVRVVGTYGYMAPEYAMDGRFSEKSDVFSFGVLMLEIATGRRNTSFYDSEGSSNLMTHIWKFWNQDNVSALIDPRILVERHHRAEVVRCLHIGLLCVQELPKDRPSIPSVLSMLRSEIGELPEPGKPAFAIKSSHAHAGASSSTQPSQASSSSLNNITFSMVDGR